MGQIQIQIQVRVHPHLLSCGASGAAIALRALASAQLPVPRPFSGPFGQARPRAAIGRAAGVRHARRDLPTRVLRSRKSFCRALQRCELLPGFPRSAADARPPCSACRPICPGGGAERRIREGPRGPASPPNCRRRADVARNSVGCRACGAQRRVPGNSPAALERPCGRWGLIKGRRRGALPLAASAGLGLPRRFRLPLH